MTVLVSYDLALGGSVVRVYFIIADDPRSFEAGVIGRNTHMEYRWDWGKQSEELIIYTEYMWIRVSDTGDINHFFNQLEELFREEPCIAVQIEEAERI